jgi:branched-chain amino acid transport system permease protein
VAALVYIAFRYVIRTPFGLALQGVRDDPVRMGSLGYDVPAHRMLAFMLAGFVAALGGVLFVWWNGHIDPASISIGAAIDLLVIAVIGGLYRLEGAWVGALAFVVIQNYVRTDSLPVVGGTFHTMIGVVFLVIVLVSPGGLMGIWDSILGRLFGQRPNVPAVDDSAAAPTATTGGARS